MGNTCRTFVRELVNRAMKNEFLHKKIIFIIVFEAIELALEIGETYTLVRSDKTLTRYRVELIRLLFRRSFSLLVRGFNCNICCPCSVLPPMLASRCTILPRSCVVISHLESVVFCNFLLRLNVRSWSANEISIFKQLLYTNNLRPICASKSFRHSTIGGCGGALKQSD